MLGVLPVTATLAIYNRAASRHERFSRTLQCFRCGYDRSGLPRAVSPCPECGLTPPRPDRLEARPALALLATPFVLNGIALFIGGTVSMSAWDRRSWMIVALIAVIVSVGSAMVAWSLHDWLPARMVAGIKVPSWIAHAAFIAVAATGTFHPSSSVAHFFVVALVLMLPAGAIAGLIALGVVLRMNRIGAPLPARRRPGLGG